MRAHTALPLLLSALVWAGHAASVRAEDTPPSPAQALVADLEAAKAAQDAGLWTTALGKVGGLYEAASEPEKKALATALGAALKAKAESVPPAALDAMAATGDGDAMWKAGLKHLLPDVKAEESTPNELKALGVIEQLHPDSAIAALLLLAQKGKDPKAASQAFKALGAYERSKQRVMILDEAVKVVRLTMPGRQSNGSLAASSPRWQAMEPLAHPTLNALTGQTLSDMATWLQLFDENKKKLAALFLNPL